MPRMIAAASPRCSGVITPALDEPVESRVRKLRGIAALDHRPRLGAIFRREQSASDGILNDRLWDGHSEQTQTIPEPLAMAAHPGRACIDWGGAINGHGVSLHASGEHRVRLEAAPQWS
jgi:hypothetical protein